MEKTFPAPSMDTEREFLTCFAPPVPVGDSPAWCPGTDTRMWTGTHTGPFSLSSREEKTRSQTVTAQAMQPELLLPGYSLTQTVPLNQALSLNPALKPHPG